MKIYEITISENEKMLESWKQPKTDSAYCASLKIAMLERSRMVSGWGYEEKDFIYSENGLFAISKDNLIVTEIREVELACS